MERGAPGSRAPPSAGSPEGGARRVAGSRPEPRRGAAARKLQLGGRPGSGAAESASGRRLPLLACREPDAGGGRSPGAAMGAERGGDAATAAAEARGLLLAGAEAAAAAGEAPDWWSRGRGAGLGLTGGWGRGPPARGRPAASRVLGAGCWVLSPGSRAPGPGLRRAAPPRAPGPRPGG